MVEYWAYRRELNCRACRMQWWSSACRVLTTSYEIWCAASNASARSSAPAASAAASGASLATRKWPCSRRICFCTLLTMSSEFAPTANLLSEMPLMRWLDADLTSDASAGAGPRREVEADRASGPSGEPPSKVGTCGPRSETERARDTLKASSAAAAAGASSPWSSAGTVISHWSPLKRGICRADLMSRNSSSIVPYLSTTPSALALSSILQYHERSLSRFIGRRSSGGRA
mmetsp:Transcript_10563/g.35053  ORF Transcript_10563/g.35053 Transcript_10563/m.35053 type:complete len:231 (-) Transcript_10563:2232-2924(-)